MRNDHVFYGFIGGEHPTPEEIARHMARAHRMRSETVHEYLSRAAAWIRGALRPTRAPKEPVGQCC
jgi:hypothetical protein